MRLARSNPMCWIGAVCILVFISTFRSLLAQDTAGPEISRDSLLAAARAVIDSTRYCTVITLDENGSPRARPMEPFPPEPDMTIWLGTKRNTRKVEDIKRDPTIVLCYLMPSGMGYVSVYGKAELVDDLTARQKWWKPEWAGFYPDKEKDFIPIRVNPIKIEVVNYASGVAGDPKTWRPPIIEFGR
jgi:general stress protein 26